MSSTSILGEYRRGPIRLQEATNAFFFFFGELFSLFLYYIIVPQDDK